MESGEMEDTITERRKTGTDMDDLNPERRKTESGEIEDQNQERRKTDIRSEGSSNLTDFT